MEGGGGPVVQTYQGVGEFFISMHAKLFLISEAFSVKIQQPIFNIQNVNISQYSIYLISAGEPWRAHYRRLLPRHRRRLADHRGRDDQRALCLTS